MALSNIESKINALLKTQYRMQGISLTMKDINLVKQAILVTVGTRYEDLRLNEQLLSDLSTKIITISQNLNKARFACINFGNYNHISPEESLPHLCILDQLIENKEIQAPQDITPSMIAEHIVEEPGAKIIAKINELNIPQDIAGFIRTLKTHKAAITPPTEEPKSQTQNSWLASSGLFSRQTSYAVGVVCVGVTAAAYGLYQQYVAPTEESTSLSPD